MKRYIRNNESLARLMAFNILLVVIITILPTFVLYQYFISNYDKELTKLNLQSVSQFRNFMDQKVLKDVFDVPNLYFTDLDSNEPLVYPLKHDITKDSMRILNTSEQIYEIVNRIKYVDSIDIYYRKNQVLFQNTNVCLLPSTGCLLGFREDWLREFNNTNKMIAWLTNETSESGSAKEILTYVRSIPYFAPLNSRLGVIAINLDIDDIRKMMSEYNFMGGSPLFAVTEEGQYMMGTQDDLTWSHLDSGIRQKLLGAVEKEGMIRADVDGQPSIITYSISEINQWKYVSITPVDAFFGKSIAIRNWMLLIGSMLFLLNLAVAAWMTRKAFKPIRTEIDELKLNLERNKPVIRHTHITKLLTGNTTINDPLIPNINLTGVQINKPWIFCFIIHLHTKGNSYEQVMMHVYSLVQELEADNSLCRIYAIQDEDEHISGIVNFEEVVEMDRLILHMTTILDSKLSMGYTISVSNPHLVHETSVAEGYKEAKAALPYEFLTSEAVIRYGMLSISERKESGPILSYLQKMEDGLREGDREEVQQTITMVVEHLIGNHYTVNYCKSILGDIIVLIRKRIHATGKTSEQVLGFELHESFNQLRNMESFPEWIGPIVQLVIDKTQSGKLKTDPVLQDRINQLIQDNMSNQLSLDLVAEHLNISPNYVSKLFKTVIGSTFTEYVTDMKLKRAMVLLMEDRLSVQDISSQLGYNSTHHFIRLFKDKYGQTPKQYQKMQERRGDTE